MRINLKALGLALVAAMAMSAVAASAAQATGTFQADAYDAVAKGEQEGPDNYFEITQNPADRTECANAIYEATQVEASSTLTVTPHYSGCEKPDGTNLTVRLNGCHFEFETTGTDPEGNTIGTADVICPKGTTIEIVGPFGICHTHVQGSGDGQNQDLKGVTFTNVANGDVTVDVDITKEIHYTETDTSFCPFAGDTTREDGSFVSEVLMKGFQHGGTEDHPTTGTTAHPVDTYLTGTDTDIFVK